MTRVDIYQLPVPAWDLECPNCEHSLNGATLHRCPKCGEAFDVADVIQTWHRLRPPTYVGNESPLPDFGWSCKKCEKPLAGSTNNACQQCGEAIQRPNFIPDGEWITLHDEHTHELSEPHLARLLSREFIPFQRESDLRAIDIYMGGTRNKILVPHEFFVDALHAIVAEAHHVQSLGEAPEWSCSRCGESNPPTFEICWKCATPRAR
ncbi:MAG: hypothetical protein AB7N71_03350 [Phycisphaerae bacterium]